MRHVDLSSSMLKRNADLEQRVAELEVELHVWKQAHSQALEASEAHNVQIAALNRQISGLDYFKSVSPWLWRAPTAPANREMTRMLLEPKPAHSVRH